MSVKTYLKTYLTLGDEAQLFPGSEKTPEGTLAIPVLAVNHQVESPRDPVSGLSTGKPQHKPITIYKEVDSATTFLYTALVNNLDLVEWFLDFYKLPDPELPPLPKDPPPHIYRIMLTNAAVSNISFEMSEHEGIQSLRERVSFTYQKIAWVTFSTSETGSQLNYEASDDWEAPRT